MVVILSKVFWETFDRADKIAQMLKQASGLRLIGGRGRRLDDHRRTIRKIGRRFQNDDVSLNVAAIGHDGTRFPAGLLQAGSQMAQLKCCFEASIL